MSVEMSEVSHRVPESSQSYNQVGGGSPTATNTSKESSQGSSYGSESEECSSEEDVNQTSTSQATVANQPAPQANQAAAQPNIEFQVQQEPAPDAANPRVPVHGQRRTRSFTQSDEAQKAVIGSSILQAFWECYLAKVCIELYMVAPPHDFETYGPVYKNDSLQLLQLIATCWVPFTVARVIFTIFGAIFLSAERFQDLYYKRLFRTQLVFIAVFWFMSVGLYQRSYANIVSTVQDPEAKSRFNLVAVMLMLPYILILVTWATIDLSLVFFQSICDFIKTIRKKQSQKMRSAYHLFDRTKFNAHDECIICLAEFKVGASKVIALPCDVRHYFHLDCISDWYIQSSVCPLCKKSFTMDSVKRFNKNLPDAPPPEGEDTTVPATEVSLVSAPDAAVADTSIAITGEDLEVSGVQAAEP